MTATVSWTIDLDIHPDRRSEFQSLMTEMIAGTKDNEPGALDYQWYITEDGLRGQIYERYRNSEAVMEHLGNFGEKYADRFMEIMTPTRFVIYGKPSEAVRNALASFTPLYLMAAAGFSR